MLRRLGILIVALSVSLSGTPEAFAQAPDSRDPSEYLIKAGFIYNFAKFVEWPSAAFAQPDSPIVIGILGTDPFGPLIDQIVENKKIGAEFCRKKAEVGYGLQRTQGLQNPLCGRVRKSEI